MKRTVAIVTGLEVIENPRAVKEADALSEAGYDVTLLSSIQNPHSRPQIDTLLRGRTWRHMPVIDRTDPALKGRLSQVLARSRSRFAKEAGRRFGFDSLAQISPVAVPLAARARALRADLSILHAEPSLVAARALSKAGLPFAVDVEDWYSEDGLASDRAHRPISLMRRLEQSALADAAYVTTTSAAMAEALSAAYGCRGPKVVYNSFPLEDRDRIDGFDRDRKDRKIPSVIWFSQTVGPGRGLEDLIAAMALVKRPFQLHIRGTPRPGFNEQLSNIVPEAARERLFFHSQVPQHELLSRLCEHDVGFCGEPATPRNKDLTISNKMFEYMRAGLAIVATDTTGQREVATQAPEAVRIVPQGNAAAIARAIDDLLACEGALARARGAAFEALRGQFGWERSKRVILDAVDDFFARQ